MKRWLFCVLIMILPGLAQAWTELDETRIATIATWLPAEPQGVGPVCGDRQAWQTIAGDKRLSWVSAEAEKRLHSPFPAWNDDAYLGFTRNGTRPEGERMMNARSAWLYPLVLAECLEWRGRYLDRITEVLTELVHQPTWTWPAHDSHLTNFHAQTYDVDLMTADLGNDLAQTLWLLGDKLPADVRQAVQTALEVRIFKPMRTSLAGQAGKEHNWWLHADHNWNAVCLKGVVGAALASLPDRHDRAVFVAAGEHYIANYVGGFSDDGYTGEGPGYWNYGFSHFVTLRELLFSATQGHLDLFALPHSHEMALYGASIEMLPDNVAAFADASPRTRMDRFTLAYADQTMHLGLGKHLSTVDIPRNPPANAAPLTQASIALFSSVPAQVNAAQTTLLDPLRGWFARAGVLIERPEPGSPSRLGASIKAGGNTNHSHNDIGSYTIALGAEQPTGDPGSTVYSAKTFSKARYTIRAINSYGHPVPRIDDILQSEATHVRWNPPQVTFTPESDTYILDLRPAYALADLRELSRTFRYNRRNLGSVDLEDRFAFATDHRFEVPLITTGNWRQLDDGSIDLWQQQEHLRARIETSAAYTLVPERIDEEGKVFTRIAIRFAEPSHSGFIRVRFEPLP
jgi:hypothetical protein